MYVYFLNYFYFVNCVYSLDYTTLILVYKLSVITILVSKVRKGNSKCKPVLMK